MKMVISEISKATLWKTLETVFIITMQQLIALQVILFVILVLILAMHHYQWELGQRYIIIIVK